jgi:hypothetical protein
MSDALATRVLRDAFDDLRRGEWRVTRAFYFHRSEVPVGAIGTIQKVSVDSGGVLVSLYVKGMGSRDGVPLGALERVVARPEPPWSGITDPADPPDVVIPT